MRRPSLYLSKLPAIGAAIGVGVGKTEIKMAVVAEPDVRTNEELASLTLGLVPEINLAIKLKHKAFDDLARLDQVQP